VRYRDLTCFVTKSSFEEESLGVPLNWTVNPRTRQIDYLYSSMELMSESAWRANIRKTPQGEKVLGWLPLYFTEAHFQHSRHLIEEQMVRLVPLLRPDAAHATRFEPLIVLEVLPRLMKTMVVMLADNGIEDQGEQVERALRGYCMLHRLFLALVQHYPQLQTAVRQRLQQFLKDPRTRSKTLCPDLGNLLPLLSVSSDLGWVDLCPALLGESLARQVLWSCRDVPELASIRPATGAGRGDAATLNAASMALLQKLFDSSQLRRRLFSFHCCFLRLTSGPHGLDLQKTAALYDRTLGLPPQHMVRSLRRLLIACQSVATWPGFFRSIFTTPPTPPQLHALWVHAVRTSLACRYHTRHTDFSKIQSRGVSSFLLRGESFGRIVFCIDISGSMATQVLRTDSTSSLSRLEVVQEQIEQILASRLNHRQQFGLILFNHEAYSWRGDLLQATRGNVQEAISFVRSGAFRPSGGTNIMAALEIAFEVPNVEAVYLISDGEDEVSIPALRAMSRQGRVQCHTTAFCSGPEGCRILEQIAAATGGSYAFYNSSPVEEEDGAVGGL
jgi:Mg-chelatase subunit ChlD